MNTQKTQDKAPTSNAFFLADDDSDLTYIAADVSVTRPGSFEFAGIEAERSTRDWDISDAYGWN